MRNNNRKVLRVAALLVSMALWGSPTLAADPQATLDQLFATHTTLMSEGRLRDAVDVAQSAVEFAEKNFDSFDISVAFALRRLAHGYIQLREYEETISARTRELEIVRIVRGDAHPDTAGVLMRLAEPYSALEQHDQAFRLETEALAILEKSAGPDAADTAYALNNLARTYVMMGQERDALPLQLRALAIREKTSGPESLSAAIALSNLASTYSSLAEYSLAVPLQLRTLAILEEIAGPESPDVAIALNNLAKTYTELSRHQEALPLKLRALAIREKSLGPNDPLTVQSLNNLAVTYVYLGRYSHALPLQLRALAATEAVLAPDHPDLSQRLNNLATTYNYLGEYAQGLVLQEKALAILEKAYGQRHPSVGILLTGLSFTYGRMGRHDEALAADERALDIFQQSLGELHPYVARSLSGIGVTRYDLGQFDRAIPYLERALSVRRSALGARHPDVARSLSNLAAAYDETGRESEAITLRLQAVSISEEAWGEDHPQTAQMRASLAVALAVSGNLDLAAVLFKMAVNAYQQMREDIATIGPSELQSYTETISDTYQQLALLLTSQGRLPEAQLVLDMLKEQEQFEFIRRSAQSDPRSTRIGYSSDELAWLARYKRVADQLASLGVEMELLQKQAENGLTPEQENRRLVLSADLEAARQAFEGFLKEMQADFVRSGPARLADLDAVSEARMQELRDLLQGLGEGTVLLQYYVTGSRIGMLLTSPGVQLARSSTVSAKQLHQQIAEFRRLLRDPRSDVMPAAQALYQVLVAPVVKDLEQARARTVMLSLDGSLRYLPFGALHDGERFLVERWRLPIFTAVARNRLGEGAKTEWRAAGLGVTRGWRDFSPLPAVRREIDSIIRSKSGGVLPGEIYLDEAFTAQRLKSVGQAGFSVVHVASHFKFRPGTEADSFLLLGDGQELTLGDIRTQNYRFDAVDLLTLSACETGLGGGRDARGQEIEGFGVIAQQQGANSVLATLWPVADASTASLMADMYRRRDTLRLDKAEALRQAQLGLLTQAAYAHPYYWAPFILMGSWN